MNRHGHAIKRLLTVAAAALLLSACSNKGPINPDFGSAVHHNKFVHIINPRTADPRAAAPEMSGDRAADAVGRYRRGEVKELRIEKTSQKAVTN